MRRLGRLSTLAFSRFKFVQFLLGSGWTGEDALPIQHGNGATRWEACVLRETFCLSSLSICARRNSSFLHPPGRVVC